MSLECFFADITLFPIFLLSSCVRFREALGTGILEEILEFPPHLTRFFVPFLFLRRWTAAGWMLINFLCALFNVVLDAGDIFLRYCIDPNLCNSLTI